MAFQLSKLSTLLMACQHSMPARITRCSANLAAASLVSSSTGLSRTVGKVTGTGGLSSPRRLTSIDHPPSVISIISTGIIPAWYRMIGLPLECSVMVSVPPVVVMRVLLPQCLGVISEFN
jgi:hypothetical protein